NNGGPTRTMKLLAGSPAINAVPLASMIPGILTDQRGSGFPRQGGPFVDVGAVEFGVTPQDLNNDGNADLVFQNNAGQIYEWNMNGGGGIFSQGYLYGAGLGDWKVAGIADMNNDGFADLVFQNTVGQLYVWFLDGTGGGINFTTGSGLKPGSNYLYGAGLSDWKVVAVADVNGDGFADLLFQNGVGQIYVWFLDGTGNGINFATGSGLKTGISSKYLYDSGLGDWEVTGVADLNGDGFADLVFQNTVGQIYMWFLDGTGAGINFTTGSGLKPGSRFLYGSGLGDWRVR
ncbi:MAG: VCBS repeat-containing protein, partial [Chthoniobacteraceae bacterium]